MSNKKITDLTELVSPTIDDVFPVVDIATNTTQKAQLGNLPTTTAVTNALASKQATLVSGTNIKTINGTSVLGSGNIVTPSTPPSGVAGAIQFSAGSAFASDAANLFWDDTNNRLGVGTNAPTTSLDLNGTLTSLLTLRNGGTNFATIGSAGGNNSLRIWNAANTSTLDLFGTGQILNQTQLSFCINNIATERLLIGATTAATIKGSGSTSATTSLLVQNSAGDQALRINDDRGVVLGNATYAGITTSIAAGGVNTYSAADSHLFNTFTSGYVTQLQVKGAQVSVGTTSPNASAKFQVDSTTTGFLPPRMTTTQKNAIASPASGLILYDSTTNKLQCYNGSTWNDLF